MGILGKTCFFSINLYDDLSWFKLGFVEFRSDFINNLLTQAGFEQIMFTKIRDFMHVPRVVSHNWLPFEDPNGCSGKRKKYILNPRVLGKDMDGHIST